jgi:hypothetical protein
MNTRRCCTICLASIASVLAAPLASAAPAFPTGEYKAGDVALRFDGHGHFNLSNGGKAVVDGDYATTADQIAFTDRSGPWSCSKGEETGKYGWKYEDGTLTFTKIDARCEGRSSDLPNRGWKRQG